MNFKKIKRSHKLTFTLAIAIILFNIFTTAPQHKPQLSEKIQGVWLTHVGNSFLTYSGLNDNVFHR